MNVLLLLINMLVLFYNTKGNKKIETVFADSIFDTDRIEANRENSGYDTVEYYYMNIYTTDTDAVFVGDSITLRVQWNEIFPNKNVKNRGIMSDTTSGVLARLDSIIKTKPKKIFVMIGINDVGSNVSADEFYLNYESIISSLQQALPESDIYIQSILPVRDRGDYTDTIVKFNGLLEELASKKDVIYVDLWPEFVDEDGELKEELSYDGLHISANGYKVWKEQIEDYVLR